MRIDRHQVSDDDVIVISGGPIDGEGVMDAVMDEMHKRFPANFVIWLGPGMTFETVGETALRGALQDLIEFQQARAKARANPDLSA